MTWPVKPKHLDEHAWHREIEKTITLTVVSADPDEGRCADCGAVRTRFQCQIYPARLVVALCKDCALERAWGMEHIWVRSEAYLRQKWERDGKDEAKAARMRQRRTAQGG